MEANSVTRTEKMLSRWSMAMQTFAVLGILWNVATIAIPAAGYFFTLTLPSNGGVKVLTAADFSLVERWGVMAILSMTAWCWIWIMVQVVRMSRCFSRGELLTTSIVRLLRAFAWGLFAMGLAEIATVPLIDAYLRFLRKGAPIDDLWAACIGGGMLESFMAGILFVILAKIWDISIAMREELELTV
ncbi:MAG: DUF2975 domain-containing protein [Pirellulaceae bacterium]|nr:DUF2975 domain-containing protein [Planctomycetales bacterium]